MFIYIFNVFLSIICVLSRFIFTEDDPIWVETLTSEFISNC